MRINKLAGAILLLTAVIAANIMSVSAQSGTFSYKSKEGKTLTENDFQGDFSGVRSSVSSGGKVKFCFERPKMSFNGYAIYATKGEFTNSLADETPKIISKKGNCWTYPEKVTAGEKVSVKIYPYITLENSAKKYIQPGFSTTFTVPEKIVHPNLIRPILVSPKNAHVFTNFPRLATLEWREMSRAVKYEVKLYCDKCKDEKKPWQEYATYETYESKFITPALPGDNGYKFKVRAMYEGGKHSNWSGVRYFRFDTQKYSDAQTNVSLSISGWTNGLPMINWQSFEKGVEGYAIYVKEGALDKDEIVKQVPFFAGKNENQRQLVKMKENTLYTVKIVPYKKNAKGESYYVGEGSNTLYFTTGNN